MKKPKPVGNVDSWIDAIAKETHGWGQHIAVYVKEAFNQIQSDKGRLTKEGLGIVLEKGRRGKRKYYDGRFYGISSEIRKRFTEKIQSQNKTYTESELINTFKEKYNEEKSEKIVEQLVSKSVFHMNKDGDYMMPIPSMKDWLVSKYGKTKESTIDIPKKIFSKKEPQQVSKPITSIPKVTKRKKLRNLFGPGNVHDF